MKRFTGDYICCIVIVLLCLVVGLPRYRTGIDLHDGGLLAYGGVRVLEGEVPNRDFDSLQPPLSFYTAAAAFKLFGISLVSLRTLGLCIYVLIPVLIYAILRNLTGRVVAMMAAVPATVIGMPCFSFLPFAVWHGVLATLAASFFVIRAASSGRRWLAFMAGLATAMAMLSRHDQGFYLSIAVLVYIVVLKFARQDATDKLYRGRILGFWAAGVVAIMLPLGLYWAFCGAVPYMFKQLIVFPLTTYAKTSSLVMPVFSAERTALQNTTIGLFYLPPVVMVLAMVWVVVRLVRRRFYAKHACISFILVLSALFYCQVLARSDMNHLIITLPPFFVLCALLLDVVSKALGGVIGKLRGDVRESRRAALLTTAAVLLAAGTIETWFLLYTKDVFLVSPKLFSPNQTTRKLLLERAGVRVETKLANSVENVVRIIQRHSEPNRPVLCLPYAPMLYFLSARHNPTRWNYIWPGDQTPEEHRALVMEAQCDRPAVAVIIKRSEVKRYAPIIIDYLHAEYKIAYDFGDVTVYLPLGHSHRGRNSAGN